SRPRVSRFLSVFLATLIDLVLRSSFTFRHDSMRVTSPDCLFMSATWDLVAIGLPSGPFRESSLVHSTAGGNREGRSYCLAIPPSGACHGQDRLWYALRCAHSPFPPISR